MYKAPIPLKINLGIFAMRELYLLKYTVEVEKKDFCLYDRQGKDHYRCIQWDNGRFDTVCRQDNEMIPINLSILSIFGINILHSSGYHEHYISQWLKDYIQ